MAIHSGQRRGALAALVGFAVIYAHPAHGVSESDFLAELPVVLSASRLEQPKHLAPAAVTVIDRAMIDASPALTIPDLLRLVPGFQVGSWSGSERTVASHGMADQLGRRMQVLVDGRSVYDPVFGGALWQSLPVALTDVERIEVIRGPNAAIDGANAFVGTINITTRAPAAHDRGQAQLTVGSYGRRQVDVAENWAAANGRHRLEVRAGAEHDDGFRQRHDTLSSRRLSTRYRFQATPRDRIDVQLGLRSSDVEKGFPGDDAQPLRDTALAHHYQQISWQHLMTGGSDLSFQFYHSYQSNKDAFDYAPYPGAFLDFGFTASRYDAEVQWRGSPVPGARLVVGSGWRLDEASADYALARDANISVQQLRLFVHGEQQLSDDWLLQAGAMGEDFEGVGQYLSPRISLNHTFLPRHALRLSAARGYRIPALYEQHARFGIYSRSDGSEIFIAETSPNRVRPESIIAYEIGLVGEAAFWHTRYDLKLFRHQIEDVIDPVEIDRVLVVPPDGYASVWEFRNSGKMDLRGIELQVDTKPTARTDLHFTWSFADANGSRLKRERPGLTVYAGMRGNVPQHSFSALLRHRFQHGWHGSLSWFYVDPMVWGGEGDGQKATNRFDLKVARDWRHSGSRIRLEFLVQNLFNRRYYDFYVPNDSRTGNLFDRRLYAQLVVRH